MTTVDVVQESSPADHDESVLDARGLVVVYHGKHGQTMALHDVSLRVDPGEAVGIIGESGSGKTTLARSLVGLIKPGQGQVLHRGRDIYAMAQMARFRSLSRDVSIIFQDPRSSLNPRLGVGAVVADPLVVLRIGDRRERKARVRALLESVGLPAVMAERPVRSLSGGQLQRVALARALAVEPSVIIADEPTSALDVSVEAQVLNLLQELRRSRDLAVVIVSHDMRVIRFLADRTVVMRSGEIVEQGPTEQVYDDPQHDYTKALMAAAPTLDLDEDSPVLHEDHEEAESPEVVG